MVKRLLVLFSFAFMAVGLCTGCGSNGPNSSVASTASFATVKPMVSELEWRCEFIESKHSDEEAGSEALPVAIEIYRNDHSGAASWTGLLTYSGQQKPVSKIKLNASLRLADGKMLLRYIGSRFVLDLELPRASKVLAASGDLAFSTGDRLVSSERLTCESTSKDGFAFTP